jgi:hypothetical protein
MNPRPSALKVFAALEMKVGESAHNVIEAFTRASVAKGHTFDVLDFLGILPLGKVKYVRFRTDSPNIQGILDDRNVVFFKNGEYIAQNPAGGFLGRVSGSSMQQPYDPSLHREYRGPRLQHWERQFL